MAVDFLANAPPGLDLHESRTASNNVIGIVLFILSAIFVGLRLLTRLRYHHRTGLELDDYLIFIALLLNAGNLAFCIASGFFGLGKHIYILHPKDMRYIFILDFAVTFVYAWTVCAIKFSIIALYRRIFGMTWLGWWCVFLTTAHLALYNIILLLLTRPLSYVWDRWVGAAGVVQVNEPLFHLGMGIINLIGDLCILAVPISSIWVTQMPKTQKAAISFIFLLGSFVCFASLYRIVTVARIIDTTDMSWAISDTTTWSLVEPSVGIISGCLPTLRPLWMHLLRNGFGITVLRAKYTRRNIGTSQELNTMESIPKERTRDVKNRTILDESQLTYLGQEDDNDMKDETEMGLRKVNMEPQSQNWRDKGNEEKSWTWRADEDDMCLTTTTVQGKQRSKADEESLESGMEEGAITVQKEFYWGESK